MGQAIQCRAREPLASQNLGPVFERQVGGHDHTAPFITAGDDVEQQLGPGLARRHVAQFVENQQIETGEPAFEACQFFLFAYFQQQGDQFRNPKEPDFVSLQASGHSDRGGQVCLASTAVADQQDILPAIEVVSFRQFQDEWFIDCRLGREVERFECLLSRELGCLETSFRGFAFPLDQLQFAELQQERQMIDIVGAAALGHLLIYTLHGRQLELFEMMLEQHGVLGFGFAHGLTSVRAEAASRDW